MSDDNRILKWTSDGERMVDGEWTDETIAEDTIEYYRNKDRDMIELVGQLRANLEALRAEITLLNDVFERACKEIDLAHEWVRARAGWKAYHNYDDFVYFTQQQTHTKEESE